MTLTIIRVAAPAAVTTAVWATAAVLVGGRVEGARSGSHRRSLAAAAALSPLTGDAFVNGSAYGPERRMALRPTVPALLLAPLAWAVGVAGLAAGPLLLAAGAVAGRASPPSWSAAASACSRSGRCTGSAVAGSCSCRPAS